MLLQSCLAMKVALLDLCNLVMLMTINVDNESFIPVLWKLWDTYDHLQVLSFWQHRMFIESFTITTLSEFGNSL